MVLAAIDYELQEASLEEAPQARRSGREADSLSLLAQVAAAKRRRCPNPKSPVLFGTHKTEHIVTVTKAPCKNWSCEVCGKQKTQKAIAMLLNHINTVGGQWYFMTITPHEKWKEAGKSLENIRKNWDKLRKRIKRKSANGEFSYFATWETFEDGEWHKHLITNAELPYTEKIDPETGKTKYTSQWLKTASRECGLGFMADYQPCQNAGSAAHYLAKYLTKSMAEGVEWQPKMHRYHTSQDWTPLPDLSESTDFDWSYIDDADDLWLNLHMARDAGMKIYGAHGQLSNVSLVMNWYYEVRGLKRDYRCTPLYAPKPFYKTAMFKRKWQKGKSQHDYLM